VRKDRPGFLACLEHIREGDSLVVWRLDRLARSLRHCIEVLDELTARQVHLVMLEGPFAHTSPLTSEGKLLYAIFAALAEFEHDLIRDRVVAGLAAARTRGRKGGRRPKLSTEQQRLAAEMAQGGIGVTRIAKTLGCARQTIYSTLAQMSEVVEQPSARTDYAPGVLA
jgi:DNA invertase Pin-like site-specific DNA recombinase